MDVLSLHGNWVDLIIFLTLITYLLSGWGRGFVISMIDLAGFLLSFIGALKFSAFFGNILILNFSISRGIANALGFLIAGLISEFLFSILIHIFLKRFYKLFLQSGAKNANNRFFRANRFLGFLPVLFEGLIFTAFILTLLLALPIKGSVKNSITVSKIGGPLIGRTQVVERQLNSIFGEAVNETLSFLTINSNPISEEKVNLGFTQNQLIIDEQSEETMLTLVNQERTKSKLSLLVSNIKLREVARAHARDMFIQGYFSHYNPQGQSPFDRMNKAGIRYLAAGENLALAPNVSLAHQGLMNSPGHRANILSTDFEKVGIGVIDGGIYGEMYVQEFTN